MVVVACGSNESDSVELGAAASAELKGPEGEAMGVVMLTQGRRGVLVSANLRGLTPGYHGFHIHETGACEPDFSAAGDHFAPDGMGHGYMNQDGHHAGDLPNIYAARRWDRCCRLLQRRNYPAGGRVQFHIGW